MRQLIDDYKPSTIIVLRRQFIGTRSAFLEGLGAVALQPSSWLLARCRFRVSRGKMRRGGGPFAKDSFFKNKARRVGQGRSYPLEGKDRPR
jgi:hypothetical protein